MDIFKFNNPTEPTLMEQGEIINGLTSKLWVERYAEAGEFTLVGPASKQLREEVPIGSFISHTNSEVLMVVEDHEIDDSKDSEAELIITGRGFEAYGDNRIVGSNQTYPTTGGLPEYTLASADSAIQATVLLANHLLASSLVNDSDAIPYLEITRTGTGGTSEERIVRRGGLYTRLLEILSIDDVGLKTLRPGPWSTASNPESFSIHVYTGNDLSNEIIFSNQTGEIESSQYLWSNRKNKTAAYVYGRWVDTVVTGSEVEYDRRFMLVDAADLDQDYTAAPTGGTRTTIVNKMNQRGIEALSEQNDISLVNAEASENAQTWYYRKDFNVGDIVTVVGNYSEPAPFRIKEYVEVDDKDGESGYPSLTPYIP